MSYIPGEYWIEQGKTYKEQFHYNKKFELQEQMLIDYLKSSVSIPQPFFTVLEVGCGFGRITKLLLSNFPDINEYVAVDISPHQVENAKEYVKPALEARKRRRNNKDKDNDSVNLKFIVSDILSLEQLNKKYDLVIASEVLLHVLPSQIEQVIQKLVNMSNKHVINIDWYEEQIPKKTASHNFIHNYEKIYKSFSSVKKLYRIPIEKKRGLSLLFKLDTKQSIFHVIV
jgi:SAM-dependent methyltransferase